MSNNRKNTASLCFMVLIWTTLLVLWAWKSLENTNLNFKFKTEEEIINGSP